MRDWKDVFDKMPVAMLYVKCSGLENEDLKMEIEHVSDKMLLLLNMDYEEVIHKDFFEILSEYKEDRNFIKIVQDCNDKNLAYTKYVRQLTNFININIQKINDEYFLLYFETCIDKCFKKI